MTRRKRNLYKWKHLGKGVGQKDGIADTVNLALFKIEPKNKSQQRKRNNKLITFIFLILKRDPRIFSRGKLDKENLEKTHYI